MHFVYCCLASLGSDTDRVRSRDLCGDFTFSGQIWAHGTIVLCKHIHEVSTDRASLSRLVLGLWTCFFKHQSLVSITFVHAKIIFRYGPLFASELLMATNASEVVSDKNFTLEQLLPCLIVTRYWVMWRNSLLRNYKKRNELISSLIQYKIRYKYASNLLIGLDLQVAVNVTRVLLFRSWLICKQWIFILRGYLCLPKLIHVYVVSSRWGNATKQIWRLKPVDGLTGTTSSLFRLLYMHLNGSWMPSHWWTICIGLYKCVQLSYILCHTSLGHNKTNAFTELWNWNTAEMKFHCECNKIFNLT